MKVVAGSGADEVGSLLGGGDGENGGLGECLGCLSGVKVPGCVTSACLIGPHFLLETNALLN